MSATLMLKVIVGSRAHGLANPDSDYDYRGVFLHPTRTILNPFAQKSKDTTWIEGAASEAGKVDDTAWELSHFLSLATHCNPTILEVFAAPVIEATKDADALRDLLPYIWHPKGVRDAFVGYGLNQRKKFLDGKDTRQAKYAVAYLRVLYQAFVLLTTKRLVVDMTDAPVFDTLRAWRRSDYTIGEVIQATREWQQRIEDAVPACDQTQDLAPVEAYLLDVRQRNW